MALDGLRKKIDRPAVLQRFFDAVSGAGCHPTSKFPLFAVATALAGNLPGTTALNIKDGSVEDLMNGSWDLLYWHGYVQMSLDSAHTYRVPRFYSYDSNAVGLFLRMEQDDDTVRLAYDSDTPESPFSGLIQDGLKQVRRTSLDGRALVDRIHAVLPSAYHCREYQAARELFAGSVGLCCSQAGPERVYVMKRPSRS